MVCLDEVHLLLDHGSDFRTEIPDLQPSLFDILRVDESTTNLRALGLSMTATAQIDIREQYKQITGLELVDNNIHWPSAKEMTRRNVRMTVFLGEKSIDRFKKMLLPIVSKTDAKAIFYTNTRARANSVCEKLESWLDEKSTTADIDVVCVEGNLTREQKFHNIREFTMDRVVDGFSARILVATSNCGLDSKRVQFVCHKGFADSTECAQQELGRAGCRPGASPATDEYFVCISLESYIALLKRVQTNGGTSNRIRKFLNAGNSADYRLFSRNCALARVPPCCV